MELERRDFEESLVEESLLELERRDFEASVYGVIGSLLELGRRDIEESSEKESLSELERSDFEESLMEDKQGEQEVSSSVTLEERGWWLILEVEELECTKGTLEDVMEIVLESLFDWIFGGNE